MSVLILASHDLELPSLGIGLGLGRQNLVPAVWMYSRVLVLVFNFVSFVSKTNKF